MLDFGGLQVSQCFVFPLTYEAYCFKTFSGVGQFAKHCADVD